MDVAYIVYDGATLRRRAQCLQVWVRRERKEELQLDGLRQLVIMGNVTISPSAMALLVSRGIDTVLLSPRGKYRARIVGSLSSSVTLRMAQYRAFSEPDRRLDFARRVVIAKITNQRELLLRHARRRPDSRELRVASKSLKAALFRVRSVATLDQVRGCEGSAAAAYFRVFGVLLTAPGFTFRGRTRRPPLDPVNALLSLGYTLLTNVVNAAVEVVGLDPYLGALHAPLAGRPSLVCDLVEEHRAPVVDSLVVAAINKGAFKPDDFEEMGPGEPVVLHQATVRWLVTLFERRLQRRIAYSDTGQRLAYRDVVEQQTRRLARWLLDDEPWDRAAAPRRRQPAAPVDTQGSALPEPQGSALPEPQES